MFGSAHLDPTVIQELRMIMGGDFSLLVQTFVRDSAQRIESIRDAIREADPDALRGAAHSFKGSAGNMGATRLAAICRTLEESGRLGEIGGIGSALAELVSEYSCVEREITALLR